MKTQPDMVLGERSKCYFRMLEEKKKRKTRESKIDVIDVVTHKPQNF